MTVEDAIRQIAGQGSFSLTVVRVSSGSYQASLQTSGNSFRVKIDPDPADALLRVLELLPDPAFRQSEPTGSVFE